MYLLEYRFVRKKRYFYISDILRMMKLKSFRKTGLIVSSLLALPLFLMFTNPEKLPLPLLMVPILLVFIISYVLMYTILGSLRSAMPKSKRRFIAGVASALPTLLVILQSIQQLTVKDVLIVLGLWVLCVWYLQKIDFI